MQPIFPASTPNHGPAQRADEIFDIVNDRDEVIGQATRAEAHARKLWHRAVHVVVVGSDGRIFLQKRSMAKDTSPGCWDSASSGHVDSGEDYAVAAVRELREEIGLIIAGPQFLEPLIKLTPCEDTGWEFMWIYRLKSDGPFVLNAAEIERGEWWTHSAISAEIARAPKSFTRAFRLWWSLAAGKLLS